MQPVVIGIAGGSGAGKSTLVDAIAAAAPTPVSTLSFDNYYREFGHLDLAARSQLNFDHPNSLDVASFVADVEQLRAGRAVAVATYDFARHTRSTDVVVIEPRPLVVVDGILLLAFDEICRQLDVRVFVEASDRVRTDRRVARDVSDRGRTEAFAREQIDRSVRPMFGEFVAPTADRAHVVVDGTQPPEVSAVAVLGWAMAIRDGDVAGRASGDDAGAQRSRTRRMARA